MEIFDICDEYGLPTGETVSRKEAHEQGIRHRTAHVWIIREKEGRCQVLLQKRSLQKDSFPGLLDTSSAGHIPAGDEPPVSAVRELKEELGIGALPEELEYAGQFPIRYERMFHGRPFRDNEIASVYILRRNISAEDITVQEEEIDSVGWYDLEDTYRKCLSGDPAYCVPIGGLNVLIRKLNLPELAKLYKEDIVRKCRRLTSAYDRELAILIRRSLKEHHLDIPGTVYYDAGLEHLSEFYGADAGKRDYFILSDKSEVFGGIGLAEFSPMESCAELQKLYLADCVKGFGLGYDMIRLVENRARELGYRRMYLETHTNLQAAIHIYERSGYRQIPRPAEVVHSTMNRFYLKEL